MIRVLEAVTAAVTRHGCTTVAAKIPRPPRWARGLDAATTVR